MPNPGAARNDCSRRPRRRRPVPEFQRTISARFYPRPPVARGDPRIPAGYPGPGARVPLFPAPAAFSLVRKGGSPGSRSSGVIIARDRRYPASPDVHRACEAVRNSPPAPPADRPSEEHRTITPARMEPRSPGISIDSAYPVGPPRYLLSGCFRYGPYNNSSTNSTHLKSRSCAFFSWRR